MQGLLCPIPTPWCKRCVDDVISIVKKDQVDILFNHINQMDAHIKFTMKSPHSEGSIPFLDTKCSPNSNNAIQTTVYKKTYSHIDRYVDWNSNHPTSAKRSVTQTLTQRGKMVCSTTALVAEEVSYPHVVLHRNNYPDCFLKKTNIRSQVDPPTTQDTTKEAFISVSYLPGLSKEFRRIFRTPKYK